jgi:alkyl hydroperoxide reductase subunit AhpC
VAKIKPGFDKRNVRVIGLSLDQLDSHTGWAKDIQETQETALIFPVSADARHKIADLYDMFHPEISDIFTVRSVFVIGPDKKINLMITFPASTGRNFDEILRVVDALQLTASHSVATPVKWRNGDDCIFLPSLSDEEAKGKFPKGWKTLKSYLRLTPQPNKLAIASRNAPASPSWRGASNGVVKVKGPSSSNEPSLSLCVMWWRAMMPVREAHDDRRGAKLRGPSTACAAQR